MPENKKHIALLTTWFPPQHGVAVNRMLAFVKYLNHDKFDISVVTLRKANEPEQEIIEGAKVYRIRNNSILSTIPTKAGEPKFVHNLKVLWNVILNNTKTVEYAGWIKSAAAQLEKIHSENNIDILLSSFAPVETHMAAIAFCKKYPQVKWIADMRDEMSGSPYISNKSRGFFKEVESEINLHASAVTMASNAILKDLKAPLNSVKHFEEIRNGFDHTISPKNNFNETFTIAYAGTFYGDIKPITFLKGLKQFVQKTNSRIHLQFIGTNKNFDLPSEFVSSCEFIQKLENTAAVELLSKADATLLILPASGRKGVYTGKLFDYLSVMKPIIAVTDVEDVAAKLIQECNAGFIADFNTIDEIEKAIGNAYNLWKERKTLSYEKEKIALLHRKYQVKKLEALIDRLIAI